MDSPFGFLVFPVISGTYYSAPELRVHLDLSNKYSGTKISYTVATELTDCEITVVFIPIAEIAKVLHRYKNSILRFNPRSYLEFEGQKVNQAIRKTVLETKTNEFALFNNGITMMSDATDLNERIGQRNKAQLTLMNPQIINGGQTAYTLSRLYEELTDSEREQAFLGKEVLLKIITVIETEGKQSSPEATADLISRISSATNQQTTVINADKFSNDHVFLDLQKLLFRRYSLLFERKRGEFADGIHKGYVKADQIIECNLFFRLFLAVRGDIGEAASKRLFMRFRVPERTTEDLTLLDRVAFAFWIYKSAYRQDGKQDGKKDIGSNRDRTILAKIYVLANRDLPDEIEDWEKEARTRFTDLHSDWDAFVKTSSSHKKEFWKNVVDPKTGKTITAFGAAKWMHSSDFPDDIRTYFGSPKYSPPKSPFLEANHYKHRSVPREERKERQKLRKGEFIPLDSSEEKDLTSAGEPQEE